MSKLDDFRRKKSVHLWPITLLRVYTGAFFSYHGLSKLRDPRFEDALAGFVTGQLDNTVGFFRPFLESVVLPHKGVFALLVSWGEFAIGIALVIGLASRWMSLLGALMVGSYWMAKGSWFLAPQNHDFVWLVIFVVLAGVHAGRAHSLDAALAGRFRFLN